MMLSFTLTPHQSDMQTCSFAASFDESDLHISMGVGPNITYAVKFDRIFVDAQIVTWSPASVDGEIRSVLL
jgi:hypothetical protein